MAMQLKKKWATALAVILPLLVGFSRVVVGAHYPTDVLGGWVIAMAAMLLVPWLEKKIRNQYVLYAVLILLALPGLFYCKSGDFFTGFGLMIGFILGNIVEEKYIQFKNTRSIVRTILRVIGGLAIIFGLNTLLKLPLSKEFLSDGSYASLLVRCGRYAIVSFLGFGVYPALFKYTAKIGAK